MIGITVDAGDHCKKRAAIPLAPCISSGPLDVEFRIVKSAKKDISRLFRSVFRLVQRFFKKNFQELQSTLVSSMKGKKLYLIFPTAREHKCLKTISSNAGSD
jgi:hypothetical protein